MRDIEQKCRDRMRKSLNDITDTLIWSLKELQLVNKVLDTLERKEKPTRKVTAKAPVAYSNRGE
jgi:hypothetical protein